MTIEVRFSRELQIKLERIAAENHSGIDEYVEHLVEHYIDHDAWIRGKAKEALDQLGRGEFVTHEEVGMRLKRMFGG